MDVAKLMAQLDRSDKARTDTESRMVDLKNENNKLTEKYNKSNVTIKNLTADIKDCREKLKISEESLEKATVKIFFYAEIVKILTNFLFYFRYARNCFKIL